MRQADCDIKGRRYGMYQDDSSMMGRGFGMHRGNYGMMPRQPGMMQHGLGRMLFLDRIEDLQLTPDQVARLKVIHTDCRKETIRQGAEVRIARLELADLLDESTWIPAAAEKLVRKIKTLEGDIQVRHLRAIAEARKVLTAEQLRQADAGGVDEEAEGLFK